MIRPLVATLTALLACGCAQVREITGGPKDDLGPGLIGAAPSHGSIRFTGNRFVLRFDERVQVRRPAAGLLVSPPIDPPPTIRLAGPREVEVRWTSPLRENTTYSFAVGEAIQDLTEGNPSTGLTYTFSTGDALDSLMIAGTVRHAYTLAPQEGVLVMAYEFGDTAAFTSGRPAFATRTDKQGGFAMRHLPGQAFHVCALKDLNGNYRFDLPSEEIAFAPSASTPFNPGDSLARPLLLQSFQETSSSQRVLAASVTDDRAWRLVLAKPAERIGVRDIAREGGRLSWEQEWNTLRDTVLLWPSDTMALGEGRFELETEEGALDTLRYLALRPMPYELAVRAEKNPSADGSIVRIRAARPIASFDPELVRFATDSLWVAGTIERDSIEARTLLIRAQGQLPANTQLMLLPRALRDTYGGTHDTLRFAVGPVPASSLGLLRVSLTADDAAQRYALLELLDARGISIRKQSGMIPGHRVAWERLEPGNHTLRLIVDTNGNGRWDPGSWREQRQPERVHLHGETIQVRAGWDLGVDWLLKVE